MQRNFLERGSTWFPWLALCGYLGFLGACAEPEAPTPGTGPNVILICLDTVRADHLGAYGYGRDTTPNLDALAKRSLVFADASSTAGWTKPSVPSFLTGTYPSEHGVWEGSAHGEAGDVTDLLPASAFTLAEGFQEQGYATSAFVHNAQLRFGNGFEQGFDAYVEERMDAREIRERGLAWIDEQGAKEGPFFLYLHFLDAHWPYPAPEEWITRFAPAEATARFQGKASKELYDAINKGEHEMTAEDGEALVALYDGALAYLDSEIGVLLEELDARGLRDDTLLCVVADHGEEFGEHGRVGHGHGLWENLLRVPWILYVPRREGQRLETPVSLIDLFPTLAAAAGLPIPPGLDGVNRLERPAEDRAILAEHKAPDRYMQSLRVGQEKLRRMFTPPLHAGEAELLLPVDPQTRWEAEFEREGDKLVITQLKPRDEELDDPPEIKGPIAELGPDHFRVAGVRVRYDETSRRQTGEDTSGPALEDGLVVKVRGPIEDDELYAERIKFYPPGESVQPEVRATVEALLRPNGSHADHGLRMGGLTLVVTKETRLKDADGEEKKRKRELSRDEIAALLEAGAGAFAQDQDYLTERLLYELGRDPEELAPRPAEAGSTLDRRLDELGRTLSQKRIFGQNDRLTLDAKALQALQDIGYGGE